MHKHTLVQTALVLVVLGLFASCDLPQAPGGTGLLVIAMPGSSDARAIRLPSSVIDGMIYRLVFTGPGDVPDQYARSGETITVNLASGSWSIRVDAFYLRPFDIIGLIEDGLPLEAWLDYAVPAGEGISEEVVIIAGRHNRVNIPMMVLDDFTRPNVFSDGTVWKWAVSAVLQAEHQAHFEGDDLFTVKYQWFSSTENSTENGEPLDEPGAQEAVFYPNIGNERVFFYCKITYEYPGSTAEVQARTTFTEPVAIVPHNSNGLQFVIDMTDSGGTIILPAGDFSMTGTVTVSGKEIILTSGYGGASLKRQPGHGDEMIVIRNEGTLTLQGMGDNYRLILDGNKDQFTGYTGSLVRVRNSSVLVMENNVFLENNFAYVGGGVEFDSGTFFIMNGGVIIDNDALENGGGVLARGTFIMGGGRISNNEVIGSPGVGSGGGVNLSSTGSFTMDDGIITGNKARSGGGVSVSGNTDAVGDPTIFTMNGGEITLNHAFVNSGGGNGGGVNVSERATFTVTTGIITGNTAENNGGGVYIRSSQSNRQLSFIMSGGEITDNDADNGGGVYVDQYTTFTMRDSARLHPDNEVYLREQSGSSLPRSITIGGLLTAESPVATIKTDSYSSSRVVLSVATDGDTNLIAANHTKFAVVPSVNELWGVNTNGNLLRTGFRVNSTSDLGWQVGGLRYALENAQNGNLIIVDLQPGTIIPLNSTLAINRNITIEGNGVTLTLQNNVDPGTSSRLMNIAGNTTVTIRSMHFTGGRMGNGVSDAGAAILNNGILTLESCIFSNNGVSDNNASGSAIMNMSAATLNVKGCTFYANWMSGTYPAIGGGAIHNAGNLNLIGNLFYGNAADANNTVYPVAVSNSGTVVSGGYNVVDLPLGTNVDDGESGWTAGTEDTTFSGLGITIAPVNAAFIPGSNAINIMPANSTDFPATDFNGKQRIGSAGAVNYEELPPLLGTVHITGSGNGPFLVDDDLTADISELNETGTISYQWLMNGIPVFGAVAQNIIPGGGNNLNFSVVVKSTGNSGSITSTPVPVFRTILEDLHLKLENFSDGLIGNHILGNNIDLSALGDPLTPIGNETNPFTGIFDGGGFTISGQTIEAADGVTSGLFGIIGPGGIVRNLGLMDVDISGSGQDVGGIAGVNWGTIQDCFVTGSISGTANVGGIAGRNHGLVKNCYSTAAVSTINGFVGGIVGIHEEPLGSVERSVALNDRVTTEMEILDNIGRVVGFYNGNLSLNYARQDMDIRHNVNPNGTDGTQKDVDDAKTTTKDGESINKTQWEDKTWWEDLGFTAAWWYDNAYLPPDLDD